MLQNYSTYVQTKNRATVLKNRRNADFETNIDTNEKYKEAILRLEKISCQAIFTSHNCTKENGTHTTSSTELANCFPEYYASVDHHNALHITHLTQHPHVCNQ